MSLFLLPIEPHLAYCGHMMKRPDFFRKLYAWWVGEYSQWLCTTVANGVGSVQYSAALSAVICQTWKVIIDAEQSWILITM